MFAWFWNLFYGEPNSQKKTVGISNREVVFNEQEENKETNSSTLQAQRGEPRFTDSLLVRTKTSLRHTDQQDPYKDENEITVNELVKTRDKLRSVATTSQ